MAHKSMVGGTAYNISSGKSMVSGTVYDIKKGRTLVEGTGYDINFKPEATAMLYSDNSFVFQEGADIEEGKTLVASYTNFEDITTSPRWNGKQKNFTSVSFNTEIAPVSMNQWFVGARNMKANISTFTNLNMNNVTSMFSTYNNCSNLTGSPVCGDNVINMYYTYSNCSNLTGSPVCGEKVTNMARTYFNCYNLTGSPVCGNNVTSMGSTYSNCYNLTGFPVCGDNVTDMYYTYGECYNLTGSPVCGEKVTNMTNTYYNCCNLTGSPVCGDNVTNMGSTYENCSNLTGSPVCGNNVTNMSNTYSNCSNLTGNAYFYSSVVNHSRNCFCNKNNSKQLNIYVPSGSTTQTTVLISNAYSLIGKSITYTNAGTYHYNTKYNIYIYPVENVAAARAANGD